MKTEYDDEWHEEWLASVAEPRKAIEAFLSRIDVR